MKRYACILVPPANPQQRLHLPLFDTYRDALQKYLHRSKRFDILFFAHLGVEPGGRPDSPLLAPEIAGAATTRHLEVPGSAWNPLLVQLHSELLTHDYSDSIHFFWADSPLLNSHLEQDVEKLFFDYQADYAFADGYPQGLAPEILRVSRLLSALQISHIHNLQIGRGGLFELIQKDINSFHIETKVSDADFRLNRLELNSGTRSSHNILGLICGELAKLDAGENPRPEVLESVFDEASVPQRGLPAVLHLQITDSCAQTCSYCPFPVLKPDLLASKGVMERAEILRVCKQFLEWTGGGTVSLSPLGEPGRHPELPQILEELLALRGLSLVVETSGIGWDPKNMEAVARLRAAAPGRIKIIIGADAWDEASYREVHSGSFAEFLAFCDAAFAADPGSTWVQIVREKGREAGLLKFLKFWESRTSNIIIQKFDSWAGYLENRVVVDLRPLRRQPCWHIKREFVVLIDGSVPLCRQEIPREPVGNVKDKTMEELWESIGAVYDRHRSSDIPERCKICDEFYTFTY